MMLKKYLPFFALIVAAAFLYLVKQNQRGTGNGSPSSTIQVPAMEAEGFSRDTSHIIYSKHAVCRMACRFIDESEVKEILMNGQINYAKMEVDERGKTFPVEGVTHDKQSVRIVVAPKNNGIVIVTVIDLNTDWDCNCN